MIRRNTALLLVVLAATSTSAWLGSPLQAKPSVNPQALLPIQPRTRHVARLTGAGGDVSFAVLEFSHAIVSPRDSASGLPTGKRQHKPVTVTKPVDKSSPILLKACIGGEPFERVEIMTLVRTSTGFVPFVTVSLDNAFVGSINPQGGLDRPTEEVAFYYNRISFTYAETGTTVEDFWSGEYP